MRRRWFGGELPAVEYVWYNELMNSWCALGAFFGGFVVAQLWKFVEGLVRRKGRLRISNVGELIDDLSRAGGMPSGHAASMAALTMYFGCTMGFDSGLFILSLAFFGVVVYDATHVRYAVGRQGEALNGLLKATGKAELPVIEGHTVLQLLKKKLAKALF